MSLSSLASGRAAVTTAAGSSVSEWASFDWIVKALSSPGAQSFEVERALNILTDTGPGTGNVERRLSVSSTSATSGRFASVIELITGVINDLDDRDDGYLFSEALPHFVPVGWSQFLRAAAIEDRDFELPWLADLDD